MGRPVALEPSTAMGRDTAVTATALLQQLVAIDSVNPTIVAGGSGEAEIAAFVARWLERAGLDVALQEAAPGRPNVIGRARGSRPGATLVFNAHMDTVGVAGMSDPHRPRIEGDRLYGRGAYDMKAGLAAIMLVGAAAIEERFAGEVVVTAVADEEAFSIGTERLVRDLRADAAIVTEPTALDIVVAHKGFAWAEVETHGFAAHGSRYDLGVDAIAKMGEVLRRLGDLEERLAASPTRHPLLGRGSVHSSTITGGQEISSYPESCRLALERRTLPGEDGVAAEIASLADGLDGEARVTFVRQPLETSPDARIVLTLTAAATAAGRTPDLVGEHGWADAGLFGAAGIPACLYGPGGAGAHEVVEWADLRQLEQAVTVLQTTARDFCSAATAF